MDQMTGTVTYRPVDETERAVPILRQDDGRIVGQIRWNLKGNGVTLRSPRPPIVLHRVSFVYEDVDGVLQEDAYLEVRGLKDIVRLGRYAYAPTVH